MSGTDPRPLLARLGARQGTARLLITHLAAQLAQAGAADGVYPCTLGDLATHLGVTPAGVTKVLQRLALAGLELRVPYGVGADGRPLYAAPGRPLRLHLPAVGAEATGPSTHPPRVDTRVDTQPRVDGVHPQSAGQARVDTRPPFQPRVDSCPSCGHVLPGQARVDRCPPLAMPPPTGVVTPPAPASSAGRRTARPLAAGGWRDWDPTGGRRGRGAVRYRCDEHADLPATDPGPPCAGCRDVRATSAQPRCRAASAAAPAARQRPLWPTATTPTTTPTIPVDAGTTGGVRRDQVTDPDELARRDAARAAARAAATPRRSRAS